MANLDVHLHSVPRGDTPALPRVNTITTADLRHAPRLGWEDFKAQPSHLAFVALMYPVIGVLLAQATVSFNIFPLLFPLLGGFAITDCP